MAKEYNMTKQDTKAWVDAIFDTLGKAIVEEDSVTIYGFGSFKHKDRAPRVGRDLNNNTEMQIPARTIIIFEPSELITQSLNTTEENEEVDNEE